MFPLRSYYLTLLLAQPVPVGAAVRAGDTNRLAAQRPIRSRALLIVSEAWLEVGKEILVRRSRRARTPVLVKTFLTCDCTVCTEITRRSAMPMVEEPGNTSLVNCRSR
jgi:hypothetical protein